MKRRNRVVLGITSAVSAVAFAAVPAGAGSDSPTAELDYGNDAAKRGALALDLTGTAGRDRIDVAGLPVRDIVVSVPAPATIDGPAECTENTPQQFTCDGSLGIDAIRGFMGPAGDKFIAKNSLRYITNQYGGSGNDVLKGGRKFDFFNGQGGGNDTCRGRKGPETLKKCE